MAFPADCEIEPSDFAQLIDSQRSKIDVAVVKHLALSDPYSNLMTRGTFNSGLGETQILAVTPRAAMGQSLTRPEGVAFSQSCGLLGNIDQYGNQRYEATPKILQGRTAPICVKQQYFAVRQLLSQAINELKKGITKVISADIRAHMLDLSGVKYVVPAPSQAWSAGYSGSEWAVSTPFNGNLPGSQLTFRAAQKLYSTMKYDFEPEQFGDGSNGHAVLITSQELNDVLRNEAPLNNVLTASTEGGFKDGHDGLWKYAFIDTNFRGLKLAIDPKPLRFNSLLPDGSPDLIEPYIKTQTTSGGFTDVTNPDWTFASYEVAFLVFKDAFERRVPASFSGEGEAKWMAGFFGGELKWSNVEDNQCNAWGDFGYFKWRVAKAIIPKAPHYVAAILTKRCDSDWTSATATCSDLSDLTDV